MWIHIKIQFKKLDPILVSTPDDGLLKVETCSGTPLNVDALLSICLRLHWKILFLCRRPHLRYNAQQQDAYCTGDRYTYLPFPYV
jgi:hypothetical protein